MRDVRDCTPAYIGRDARLLKRLSEASGLHILTNTGYYGAANDKYLPKHAFTETADQLAARWIQEAEHGIDGTGISPAFMKIGVDEAPLSDVDAKLVKAAAVTLKATGLTIASHTTTGAAAMAEIDILDRAGVSPTGSSGSTRTTNATRRSTCVLQRPAPGWSSTASLRRASRATSIWSAR